MLSQGKALYQAKLILDYLPENEYKLIPKKEIDYIEKNYEYDKNIVINPDIPLEKQKIDDRTYDILEEIVKKTETNQRKYNNNKVSDYVENGKKSNQRYDIKTENIKLKKLVELLKEENSKIPKVKGLVKAYKDALKQKDEEITKVKKENEVLRKCIKRIPRFIRKIFIKENDF